MSTLQDKLHSMFDTIEKPEVAQRQIEMFLSTIDEVTELDDSDWIEVFEDIIDEIELGEADWRVHDE